MDLGMRGGAFYLPVVYSRASEASGVSSRVIDFGQPSVILVDTSAKSKYYAGL